MLRKKITLILLMGVLILGVGALSCELESEPVTTPKDSPKKEKVSEGIMEKTMKEVDSPKIILQYGSRIQHSGSPQSSPSIYAEIWTDKEALTSWELQCGKGVLSSIFHKGQFYSIIEGNGVPILLRANKQVYWSISPNFSNLKRQHAYSLENGDLILGGYRGETNGPTTQDFYYYLKNGEPIYWELPNEIEKIHDFHFSEDGMFSFIAKVPNGALICNERLNLSYVTSNFYPIGIKEEGEDLIYWGSDCTSVGGDCAVATLWKNDEEIIYSKQEEKATVFDYLKVGTDEYVLVGVVPQAEVCVDGKIYDYELVLFKNNVETWREPCLMIEFVNPQFCEVQNTIYVCGTFSATCQGAAFTLDKRALPCKNSDSFCIGLIEITQDELEYLKKIYDLVE